VATIARKVLGRVARTGRRAGKIDEATALTSVSPLRSGVRPPGERCAVAASTLLLLTAGAAALPNPAAASTKPATLQSLGKPTVTAKCKGGSYRPATPSSPMTTISGKKWTSGFALVGTERNTFFTWHLNGSYSALSAAATLDAANSGPLLVQIPAAISG
jgi:hypothetical protein